MAHTKEGVVASLLASFAAGQRHETPYRHWLVASCLPPGAVEELNGLPFPAPALGGVSGKREVHNATRKYFDVENRASYPVIGAIAEAFQDNRVTKAIETTYGTSLGGTYLRIEYAQDTNGFWLEPHSDLGVKSFTSSTAPVRTASIASWRSRSSTSMTSMIGADGALNAKPAPWGACPGTPTSSPFMTPASTRTGDLGWRWSTSTPDHSPTA